MKEQEYYQLYRKKTLEFGYTPIGRQRFAGIIKTISTIDSTIEHIQEKQLTNSSENPDSSKPKN